MNYRIELELTEENAKVLLDSLNAYAGNKQLVADCIRSCVIRQIEIQKKGKEA